MTKSKGAEEANGVRRGLDESTDRVPQPLQPCLARHTERHAEGRQAMCCGAFAAGDARAGRAGHPTRLDRYVEGPDLWGERCSGPQCSEGQDRREGLPDEKPVRFDPQVPEVVT